MYVYIYYFIYIISVFIYNKQSFSKLMFVSLYCSMITFFIALNTKNFDRLLYEYCVAIISFIFLKRGRAKMEKSASFLGESSMVIISSVLFIAQ